MMKLRKWTSLDKAEKLGIKNALIHALICAILIFTIIILVFLMSASASGVCLIVTVHYYLSYKPPLALITLIILQFGVPIFLYFTSRREYINSAYDKLMKDNSKKQAKKMLVRGKPTKVKLIKTRNGHYSDFLLKDLSGRVDYYAVLETNHNIIVIYTKFSDENEKDFFDDISNGKRNSFDFIEMEEFSSFCTILDN